MLPGWSWSATFCLGHAGSHQRIPLRVRSDRHHPDLPALVNRVAFALCFVPCTDPDQMREIVARTLCATTASRIQVNVAEAETTFDIDHDLALETHDWGRVQILHETPAAGFYHLHLAPQGLIPRHVHTRLVEVEMIAGSTISCQCGPMSENEIVAWPLRAPHFYRNESWATPASILCVNRPRFDRTDEIVVDDSVSDVATIADARRTLCHDPWMDMLETGAEFRFAGAFPGQDVTYFVRNDIRQDADAALIAIVDGADLVVCQHHQRGWELPGGKRDPQETIEETARREALEETGIVLGPRLSSLGFFVGTGGGPAHVKQVFSATVQKQGGDWNRKEMEQVGRVHPMEFARRSRSDPAVSVLCRDSVLPIIAALLQCRIG